MREIWNSGTLQSRATTTSPPRTEHTVTGAYTGATCNDTSSPPANQRTALCQHTRSRTLYLRLDESSIYAQITAVAPTIVPEEAHVALADAISAHASARTSHGAFDLARARRTAPSHVAEASEGRGRAAAAQTSASPAATAAIFTLVGARGPRVAWSTLAG